MVLCWETTATVRPDLARAALMYQQLFSFLFGRKMTRDTRRSAARPKSASGPLPVRAHWKTLNTSRAKTSYWTAQSKIKRGTPPKAFLCPHRFHAWLLLSKPNCTITFHSAAVKTGNSSNLLSCQWLMGTPHHMCQNLSCWICCCMIFALSQSITWFSLLQWSVIADLRFKTCMGVVQSSPHSSTGV